MCILKIQYFSFLQTAGHSATLNNPTYDCTNDSLPPGSIAVNNATVVANQNMSEGYHTYHELEPVPCHSVGPKTLSQRDPTSDSEVHIYEMEAESEANSSKDDTYEHPSLSEVSYTGTTIWL